MPQDLGPFKAVIFDMDGVLLDTEPLYMQAMDQACADLGYTMTREVHNATIGMPAEAGDRVFRMAYGDAFPLERFNAYSHKIMQALVAEKGVPVKPGVEELLFELNSRDIPVAVATSTSSPTAPDRLRAAGLFDKFTTVVTRNDVTNGKPHPEPFLTAASRLDIAPDHCIALEDSFNGIRSAHGAGMRAIMVPDLLQPDADILPLCHAVMDSLHEVRAALFGLS